MTCVNNLLLILAMMLLSNGNISLFDNKNKSNKSVEESAKVETVNQDSKSMQNRKSGPKVRKIKKIKKKTRSKERTREKNKNPIKDPIRNVLHFDMGDVNRGINLMDLSEEDLDRGMEIITRTKKYMNKDERNILIKLESVLDLVKGIKKLNNVSVLSEEDESDFFRSMDEEDKKNMMIKEILEVFPEKRKQSVERAIEIKKMIDLFAELFLPDEGESGGFSLSSLADINNLGSISNLELLGNLLRSLEDKEEESENDKEYQYVEVEGNEVEDDDEEEEIQEENEDDEPINNANSNNNKYNKSKNRRRKPRNKSKRTKEV